MENLVVNKTHNFSAGPSILPQEVFKKASEAVLEINSSGLSLLEISHRSETFVSIMENARSLVKELMNLPEQYEVLFLQGGASLGFYISALNYLKDSAAYIDTGTWSTKAIKEARKVGNIDIVASSKATNFNSIPKGVVLENKYDYLHLTTNNTIYGTQFKDFPKVDIPMICDMSSDIFSKPVSVEGIDLIYAGAQKNLGPAGTTLYIFDKNSLGRSGRDLPSMLDLQVHLSKDSMFNTPPVFAIYVSMLTLEWLKSNGGLAAAEKRNQEKANVLYSEIDRNGLFKGIAEVEDRSLMNATFELTNSDLNESFLKICKDAKISGIKGHRSIGGFRASIYNAMPIESVEILVEVMKEFEIKNG